MIEIRYQSTLAGLRPDAMHGFFVGWANPPGPATLLKMLGAGSHVWLALDGERLVGYVRAISDGFYSAFVPELEVLPEYQGMGIGTTLLNNLLDELDTFYSVDAASDDEFVGFYRRFGFTHGNGMMIRRYQNQAG